ERDTETEQHRGEVRRTLLDRLPHADFDGRGSDRYGGEIAIDLRLRRVLRDADGVGGRPMAVLGQHGRGGRAIEVDQRVARVEQDAADHGAISAWRAARRNNPTGTRAR